MARSKTRKNEDPYPSSPTRPPTHNLWLKYGPGMERMQIHAFCTDWAVWACLKIAINGRKFELVDKTMGWYETEDEQLRFRIIEPSGENLMKTQPAHDWTPGQPVLGQLHTAAGIVVEVDTPHKPINETREKNRRKTRVTKPVSKDGLVSIGDICVELNMNARDARKILRNKLEKPSAGWCWPPEEVANVKKILKP